jgi:hypothetical protein
MFTFVVLVQLVYGCETWSLILREGHRLGVFENKLLRRIFGQKRDKMMGDWRKLWSFITCTLRQIYLE